MLSESAPDTSPRRVLVIEDDLDFAESLEDLLISKGFSPEKAHSEEQALALVKKSEALVALVDVRLGQSDGIELIPKLKAIQPNLLCIILTAHAETETAITALKNGAHDFLRKPVHPPEIVATLEGCFDTLQLQKEREEAVRRLEESENRFRTLVEGSIQGILIHQNLKPLFVNQALARIFGYKSPEEFLSVPSISSMLKNPEESSLTFTPAESDQPPGMAQELKCVRKGGETIWLEANLSPINWEGKEAVQVLLVDITSRKTALEELDRLGAAVEQTGDSIFITNERGEIQYVNPAFERVSGFTFGEVMGKTPQILKSEQTKDETFKDIWETLEKGSEWKGRFVNKTKSGKNYPVDATHSPLRAPSGEITHFVSVQKDMTAQVEMENRLHASQRLESLGTLAGGIAHEFNNILVPIMGYSELLQENLADSPKLAGYAETIRKAASRAKGLVSEILGFSRKRNSNPAKLYLNEVGSEAIRLLEAGIPKNVTIVHELDQNTPPVFADGSQIHQVIMNLCINGVQSMPEGGELKIKIKPKTLSGESFFLGENLSGNYVALTISDTGTGIDPETLPRIFEPFFTTKEVGQGTGLGLSLTYGIVEESKGGLNVVTAPGQGTTFEIYLPVIEETTQPKQTPKKLLKGNGASILVVDDETQVLQWEKIMLEGMGYKVTALKTPLEAKNLFEENPQAFDLVLTDFSMPEMNGMELAESLMQTKPGLPVILLTGHSEKLTPEEALKKGFKAYLNKPISGNDLALTVQEALATGKNK